MADRQRLSEYELGGVLLAISVSLRYVSSHSGALARQFHALAMHFRAEAHPAVSQLDDEQTPVRWPDDGE